MIALRRETFDFGILPASFLVPRAESVASLAPIQRRLLQCAYPSRADPAQTVVTLTDAAQALGITHTNAAHVIIAESSRIDRTGRNRPKTKCRSRARPPTPPRVCPSSHSLRASLVDKFFGAVSGCVGCGQLCVSVSENGAHTEIG